MYEKKLLIRQANVKELDLILRNENLCYQFPWSKKMLEDCLLNQHLSLELNIFKHKENESKYVFLVMFCDDKMIGHLIVQKVVDEFHLHNLCILPDHQGKKLGQKWMDYLMLLVTRLEIMQIILEVRESNLTAMHLYEKNGFHAIGTRGKYYQQSSHGEAENAVILKWTSA